jgi:alkylated DNA repair dioxygenase AlkB
MYHYITGTKSYLIDNIPELNIDIDEIKKEINFQSMISYGQPVPRLIAIQGKIENNLKPLYRHPIDSQPELTPFTKTTQHICNTLNKLLHQDFNHVLIQLYRDGDDNIGEHSDKTLDIDKNSVIVNYTLGASRTLRLKDKQYKTITKIKLKHNSLFVLDLDTNRTHLHSIKKDKRERFLKDEDELFNNGERISFTFRKINTFIDHNNIIYGQGIPKINKINDELDMLQAFTKENHDYNFDWNENYRNGFYSINLKSLN